MKKYAWIVALMAALGLVFVACGGGNNDPGNDGDEWSIDLTKNGNVTVKLQANEYGEGSGNGETSATGKFGYQNEEGNSPVAASFARMKINKDDKYSMRVSFTVSKTATHDIMMGFVDRDASVSYWKPLTWIPDDETFTRYPFEVDDLNDGIDNVILTLTALESAGGNGAMRNFLVFSTDDEPQVSTTDSYNLIFTVFKIWKGELADEPDWDNVGAGEDEGFTVKVGDAEQLVMPSAVGGEVELIDGGFTFSTDEFNYQGTFATFKVDLGASKTLKDFEKVTFTFSGIEGDTNDKNLELWAREDAFGSAMWGAQPIVGKQDNEHRYGGPGAAAMEIVIGGSTAGAGAFISAITGNMVHFVIYCPGGGNNAASYSITDIVFVPGAAGAFKAVERIDITPASEFIGEEVTLSGAVYPYDATNQEIVWAITDAGDTGATLSGNKFTGTAAGTVSGTATIANGKPDSEAYVENFTVEIKGLASVLELSISGEFTWNNNDATHYAGWTLDADQAAKFEASDFLVIETKAGNAGGFGGFQVVFTPWTENKDFVSGGWLSHSRSTETSTFVVLKISDLTLPSDGAVESIGVANWDTVADFGLVAVHFISGSLDKPENATDLAKAGYIVDAADFTLPE